MAEVRTLSLEDILDQRAYERERNGLQEQVFAVKALRRVALGPIMSVVFENLLTVRYQIQEMARVEKLSTDAQILGELNAYNPLIPDPGELSATVFLELVDETALRDWLPKLVGIERSLVIGVGPAASRQYVRSLPEEGHADQLTREDITSSVHYVRFQFAQPQVEAFATGPVVLASDHPEYEVEVELPDATRMELLSDLLD